MSVCLSVILSLPVHTDNKHVGGRDAADHEPPAEPDGPDVPRSEEETGAGEGQSGAGAPQEDTGLYSTK